MTAVLAPAEATDHARGAPRGRRIALALPACLPALVIAIGGWSHRWMDEDAFINFRIVDQIFAGHGPVFNAGERVEAATSPLWLFVLVVGRALFGAFVSIEWIALVAGLARRSPRFSSGGYAARLQHRGSDGVVLPVGLLLVAAVAVVWDFSTSGLEMSLVWLWLAGSWWALMTVARADEIAGRRRLGCCVVLGLAPLVRPELTLDDGVPARRVVPARATPPHRVRPRRDPRRARGLRDLPHGLLRDASCPTPRSPRTPAACT